MICMQSIPKVFRFIWLGENPLPEHNRAWMATWRAFNPAWRAVLYASHPEAHNLDGFDIEPIPSLVNQWAFDNLGRWVGGRALVAAQSDLIRMELIARMGGVYLDTDVEAFQCVGDLFSGVRLFYADEWGPCQGNYLFGAAPNHPALWSAVRELRPHLESHTAHFSALDATGPNYLAPRLRAHSDCVIYPHALFNPLPARANASGVKNWPAAAIANHHYEGTWYEQVKSDENVPLEMR